MSKVILNRVDPDGTGGVRHDLGSTSQNHPRASIAADVLSPPRSSQGSVGKRAPVCGPADVWRPAEVTAGQIALKDRKGADPSEWPEDLGVQQLPRRTK